MGTESVSIGLESPLSRCFTGGTGAAGGTMRAPQSRPTQQALESLRVKASLGLCGGLGNDVAALRR